MSTPVTYVANQYNVPAYQDTGYAQGAGNLSSYLIALATGSLTLSGGSFPLTADANFGANFGLVSIYFKSRSASIATSGQVRLAATDSVTFSTSNYALTTDGSGNLTWRGNKIAGSTGAVSSITGTANQVIASAAVGDITLSLPQSIGTASTPTFGSLTLSATTNQLILGVTNTTTITSTAPAGSRIYTIPDAGSNVQFVMAAGTQTIAGAKTFSSTVTVSATTNQFILGTTNTITITSSAPASSLTYTIPDAGAAASFFMTAGTQTISGNTTLSRSASGADVALTISNTSNTAASYARLTLSVAGASGEDAVTQFVVTGVTNWTIGVDNSDSDKFKINASTTLGTASNLEMTTTGQMLGKDGTSSNPTWSFSTDGTTGMFLNASGDLRFVAGGTTYVKFLSNVATIAALAGIVAELGTGSAAVNVRFNTSTTTGGSTGTLTNCPAAGNPTGYVQISVNGTTGKIPYWT